MSDKDKIGEALKILSTLKEELERDIGSCDEMAKTLSNNSIDLKSLHGNLVAEMKKKHKSIQENGKFKSPINVLIDDQVIDIMTMTNANESLLKGEGKCEALSPTKQYSSLPPLKVGDEIVVRLTRIESPDCLYVRRGGTFSRLSYDLNQALDKIPLESLTDISEGQACLFRKAGESKVHRSRIDQGKVKLVDIGKTVEQSSGDLFSFA